MTVATLRTLVDALAVAAGMVLMSLLVCLMAVCMVHGGASPAPPGPPAGVAGPSDWCRRTSS